MDRQHQEITKLYWSDSLLISLFIVLTWLILGFAISQVLHLSHEVMFQDTTVAAGLAVGFFITGALVAVLIHLKRNRLALYREELRF